MKISELENILLDHCYEMSILKRDADPKKKENILDSLIAAIIRSGTTFDEVLSCISDVKNDEVINLDFFKNGGCVWSYINDKWINFSKALWRQTGGLGTPNAAAGEGELMFIFLSTRIEKPTRGDLKINYLDGSAEDVELKGEQTRVMGNISGKNFRNKTLRLCSEFNLSPNIANRSNIEGVELEKQAHKDHWVFELSKLSIVDRKRFISEYLKCIDGNNHNCDDVFTPDFDFTQLRRKIIKILYNSMVVDRSFDKFIILGDGNNAEIFSNNVSKFNEFVDIGKYDGYSDYFRINQDAKIGWYIS